MQSPLAVRAVSEADVHVRGIEMETQPTVGRAPLSGVQFTRLQYISNQPFTERELADLCTKVRHGAFENLSVAVANARIECMSASLRAVGLLR